MTQRANSVRELARTTRELATSANSGELTRELHGAPVCRLARGSPRLSMPHSYSIFLVNNKIKVQMGVSLASFLFLFLCVNWFTAPRVSAGGGGGGGFCFCFCAWRAGRGAGCCRTARRKQSRELFLRLEKRCPTTKRHKIPPPSAHSGGPAPLPRRPRRHAEPAARQAEPPAAPLGAPFSC